jgi:hypothetical protein
MNTDNKPLTEMSNKELIDIMARDTRPGLNEWERVSV